MKYVKKLTRVVWWAIEDLFLVAIILFLSFRFIVPVNFGNYGYGWRECVRFIKVCVGLWMLFEISRYQPERMDDEKKTFV